MTNFGHLKMSQNIWKYFKIVSNCFEIVSKYLKWSKIRCEICEFTSISSACFQKMLLIAILHFYLHFSAISFYLSFRLISKSAGWSSRLFWQILWPKMRRPISALLILLSGFSSEISLTLYFFIEHFLKRKRRTENWKYEDSSRISMFWLRHSSVKSPRIWIFILEYF